MRLPPAAAVRPNPEFLTETSPPPGPSSATAAVERGGRLLTVLGLASVTSATWRRSPSSARGCAPSAVSQRRCGPRLGSRMSWPPRSWPPAGRPTARSSRRSQSPQTQRPVALPGCPARAPGGRGSPPQQLWCRWTRGWQCWRPGLPRPTAAGWLFSARPVNSWPLKAPCSRGRRSSGGRLRFWTATYPLAVLQTGLSVRTEDAAATL